MLVISKRDTIDIPLSLGCLKEVLNGGCCLHVAFLWIQALALS